MLSIAALITGSSGFVGGRLFERCSELGWRVTGLGRRPLQTPGYFVHDLANPLTTAPGEPFDVVIHAAARASPWGSRGDFERQNVVATRHVIDYCLAHGRPRLVFISTSSVYYQAGDQLGITEDTALPTKPVNRYAATKREGEKLVQAYAGPWVILRPRAVFGPGDTVLLPRILEAARRGKLPLMVRRGPVVQADLIYIDNLVDCIIRAATDPNISGIFNLTNNQPVPLNDFLLDIFRRLNIPLPRRRVGARWAFVAAGLLEWYYALCRPGHEPPLTRFGVHVFAYSKTFDVAKMIRTFGPPKVPLATGVERLVAWVQRENAC